MPRNIILASGSEIRLTLLRKAGVVFSVEPASIDEDATRAAWVAEKATPSDVATALAELKALEVADRHPDALVIGADQILDLKGALLAKAVTRVEARSQLRQLRGQRHSLLSAAVICDRGRPVWRHVDVASLTMRDFSDAYLDAYLDRNWESIRHAVGCYKLEEEGIRLFNQIEGDYFSVLGLPLLALLSYLTRIGVLQE